jgi:hypothetical protein
MINHGSDLTKTRTRAGKTLNALCARVLVAIVLVDGCPSLCFSLELARALRGLTFELQNLGQTRREFFGPCQRN